jgi:putative alpha-1,2-mannosidase
MSSWYVFNAIGFYPYSPADPQYIVSVPLFGKVAFQLGNNKVFTIVKMGTGNRITNLTYAGHKVNGYFLPHSELAKGEELVITTK